MKKFTLLLLVLNFGFVLFGQNPKAYISNDFKKYGLKEGNIPQKWEDGIRTGGKKGTYEWWYFDAHLNDGTTIVIIFYTKPFTKINKSLIPYITINIDRPDGTSIHKNHYGKVDEFWASDTICNVKIGENYFRGNLKNYEIHFKDKDLQIDVKVKRTTQSWRPATGHFKYGEEGKEFVWVVPVPKGKTEITYTYQGKTHQLNGSCYHDHNYGNVNMAFVINHWYWSRSEIGPYTIIAAELISKKEYNNEPIIVFNISKNGKTIADDGNHVKLYRTYGKMDKVAGKPINDELKFIYEKNGIKYEYTLKRHKTLLAVKLLNGKINRALAKSLKGFDGSYYRFSGEANLKVYNNDIKSEEYTGNKAIWELMHFGLLYE